MGLLRFNENTCAEHPLSGARVATVFGKGTSQQQPALSDCRIGSPLPSLNIFKVTI